MEKQQIVELTSLLSGYVTFPFLCAIKCYFYKRFLGFKNKLWIFALAVLFTEVIGFFTMKIPFHLLGIIIDFILWLAIVCFLCKGNFIIKFYAVTVQDSLLLLISLTFLPIDFWIFPLIHNNHMSFNEHMIISFANNIFIDLITFAILFIFSKKICDFLNLKDKPLNLYNGLYLLIPCLSSYALASIFFIIQEIKIDNKKYFLHHIFPGIYYILPFITLALLISILISAYTLKKMVEGEEERQKSILIEQQFKMQLNHSNNIEGLYKEIRSVKHDMTNHLICLKNLAADNNIEDIKKYLYSISKTISKLDFKIKTGNSISDAVITEKLNIAKSKGIEFICDFLIPKDILMEPIDLCVILSNTLDNAIESCVNITDTNIAKKILIKSYIRDIYLIIEVSNTNVKKLQYNKNKIISTKLDKSNHGMGLSNIETAVKKYNGVVDIVEEKNKFTINLMLKVK